MLHNVADLLVREGVPGFVPLFYEGFELPSFDEFHHDEKAGFGFDGFDELDDVWVVKLAEDIGLLADEIVFLASEELLLDDLRLLKLKNFTLTAYSELDDFSVTWTQQPKEPAPRKSTKSKRVENLSSSSPSSSLERSH